MGNTEGNLIRKAYTTSKEGAVIQRDENVLDYLDSIKTFVLFILI